MGAVFDAELTLLHNHFALAFKMFGNDHQIFHAVGVDFDQLIQVFDGNRLVVDGVVVGGAGIGASAHFVEAGG